MMLLVLAGLCYLVIGERLVEKDYYQRFDLPRSCTEKQLKKAFKKLALQYHPDKNPDDEEAAENFVAINKAYEVLNDAEKRQIYDRFGEEGLAQKDQRDQAQRDFGYARYADMGLYDEDPHVEQLNWESWQNTASSTACWWINFFSDGCGHCRDLAPDYSRLGDRLSGICRVAVVNCQENMQMCMQLGIQAYPTVWLYPASPTHKTRQQRAPRIAQVQRDFDSMLAFFQQYTSSQTVKQVDPEGLLGQAPIAAGLEPGSEQEWLVGFCFDADVCHEVQMTLNELWIGVHPVLQVGKFDCLTEAQRETCVAAGVEAETDMMDIMQGDFYYIDARATGKPGATKPIVNRLKGNKVKELIRSALSASSPMPKMDVSTLKMLSPTLLARPARQKIGLVKDTPADSDKAYLVLFYPKQVPSLEAGEDGGDEDVLHVRTRQLLALKHLRISHPNTKIFTCETDMGALAALEEVQAICRKAQEAGQPILALIINNLYPILYSGNLADPAEMVTFFKDQIKSQVKVLSPAYMTAHIESGSESWMVDFYAPWCSHCVTLAPIYRSAAEQMSKKYPNIEWGTIDCVQYPNACARFNVKSYPSLMLFENDAAWRSDVAPPQHDIITIKTFQGEHSLKDLEDFLEEAREPSVVPLTALTFHQLVMDGTDIWIIDWYTEWCGPCMQMLPEFTKAAKMLKGLVKFGKVDCEKQTALRNQYQWLIKHYPYVVAFQPGRPEPIVFNDNGWRNQAAFVDFALKQLPAERRVTEITPGSYEAMVKKSTNPWILDFMSPRCGPCIAMKPLFETLAANVTAKPKNRLKFGLINCMTYYQFCVQQSIRAYPTFRYISKVRSVSQDLSNVADAVSLRKAVAAQYRQDQKLAVEKKKQSAASSDADTKPSHDEL
eukprot:gb/GEZN01001596.1/.p1 GENE.gb/GEZN01001596.1/~~gb/GEZN01001596.1/.p1  ORF type:complete len:891 (+),score=149.65 gb/GEZN01001596.1/:123-2795(+)